MDIITGNIVEKRMDATTNSRLLQMKCHKCKSEAHLILLGKPLCEKHWKKHCEEVENDWNKRIRPMVHNTQQDHTSTQGKIDWFHT